VALQFTTSDYVSAIGTIIQVVATIGVGVWTVVRASRPSEKTTPARSRSVSLRTVLRWLSWVALAFLAFGLYILWSGINSEEPATKGFLFKTLFYSFSIVFNLLVVILLSIVNRFLDRFASVIEILKLQSHMNLLSRQAALTDTHNLESGETGAP
jgi:hypothetical protein